VSKVKKYGLIFGSTAHHLSAELSNDVANSIDDRQCSYVLIKPLLRCFADSTLRVDIADEELDKIHLCDEICIVQSLVGKDLNNHLYSCGSKRHKCQKNNAMMDFWQNPNCSDQQDTLQRNDGLKHYKYLEHMKRLRYVDPNGCSDLATNSTSTNLKSTNSNCAGPQDATLFRNIEHVRSLRYAGADHQHGEQFNGDGIGNCSGDYYHAELGSKHSTGDSTVNSTVNNIGCRSNIGLYDSFLSYNTYNDIPHIYSVNDSIMELLLMLDLLSNRIKNYKPISLCIPYMGYSRHDKLTNEDGDLNSLGISVIARLLNGYDLASILTFDIHNDYVAGYFDCHFTSINASVLLKFLQQQESCKEMLKNVDFLIVPDLGGARRLSNIELGIPLFVLDKRKTLLSELSATDLLKNKTVLLLDDIISGGLSMRYACNFLKSQGVFGVNIFATHILGDALGLLNEDLGIGLLCTTNTVMRPKIFKDCYHEMNIMPILLSYLNMGRM